MIWALALLLFSLHSATSVNPGYKLELTRKGLDFASQVGGAAVVKILKQTKMQPFKGGEKRASMEVKNIVFKQFTGERWFYALKPPSTLSYGLTGAALEIDADFLGKTHVMLLPDLSISGKIKVRATNVALSLSNSITIDSGGRPIVKAVECSATLGTFTLSLSGSVAAWIVQMFHTLIESEIKPKICSAICDNAMKIISSNLGDKIENAIPSPIPIKDDFAFSYRMEAINVSKQGVAFSGEGLIEYKGSSAQGNGPPKLVTERKGANRMGYFYLSDYVLNSAGKITHQKGLLNVKVDKGLIPLADVFLQTTCPGKICIGTVITELSERYPGATCAVHLKTNKAPEAYFHANGIHLALDIGVSFSIYNGKGDPEKSFAAANVRGSADVTPKIHGRHVNASFTLNDFHVEEEFSTLQQPINWQFIQQYGRNLFGVQLKGLLDHGIDLPAIAGVKVVNPGIATSLHTLELSADIARV